MAIRGRRLARLERLGRQDARDALQVPLFHQHRFNRWKTMTWLGTNPACGGVR